MIPNSLRSSTNSCLEKPCRPRSGGFYTKWLRFYWDFCHKYHHDSFHSEHGALVSVVAPIDVCPAVFSKIRASVSWFYEMQTAPVGSLSIPSRLRGVSVVTRDPIKGTSSQPLPDRSHSTEPPRNLSMTLRHLPALISVGPVKLPPARAAG